MTLPELRALMIEQQALERVAHAIRSAGADPAWSYALAAITDRIARLERLVDLALADAREPDAPELPTDAPPLTVH